MRVTITAVLATITPLVLAGTVHAQAATEATTDGSAPMMELPAACMSGEGAPTADTGMGAMDMSNMEEMDGHRAMMMKGMMATQKPMMMGMLNEDPDLAFACGMIPHHQGAISMARAELEHGEDAEMRALAEEIIAAQEREIERLTTWIESQGQ
jgi:uncharacterized protein (DUF305 family)